MIEGFVRIGPLKDVESYPQWTRDLVQACSSAREAVRGHAFYQRMRDAQLSSATLRTYLIGGWPVVEQFPQYMALNLLKTRFGRSAGEDLARRWLMRNIRVELNHADHWLHWASAYGITLEDLRAQAVPTEMHALSHWLWQSCSVDDLAVSMAATHYAVEGVTGDWSGVVCSSDSYERSLPADLRKPAMRWLRLHARYDDEHPWEALEIICTLCGMEVEAQRWTQLRDAVCKSYAYMRLFLDHCLALEETGAGPRNERLQAAG